MGRAARVRRKTVIGNALGDAAVLTGAEEELVLSAAGVQHHHKVCIIQITAVHELHFTAVVLDDALPAQLLTVTDLQQFFRGNAHQANLAAQTFQRALFLKRRRNSEDSPCARPSLMGCKKYKENKNYSAKGYTCNIYI